MFLQYWMFKQVYFKLKLGILIISDPIVRTDKQINKYISSPKSYHESGINSWIYKAVSGWVSCIMRGPLSAPVLKKMIMD